MRGYQEEEIIGKAGITESYTFLSKPVEDYGLKEAIESVLQKKNDP
jgi:hypothetical protein